MSKQDALATMGQTTQTGYDENAFTNILSMGTTASRKTKVTNPYRSEILQGNEKKLEVLYYYTDKKSSDDAITDDELTPLVFDNGELIGWGWSFLNTNIQKYELRIR